MSRLPLRRDRRLPLLHFAWRWSYGLAEIAPRPFRRAWLWRFFQAMDALHDRWDYE